MVQVAGMNPLTRVSDAMLGRGVFSLQFDIIYIH